MSQLHKYAIALVQLLMGLPMQLMSEGCERKVARTRSIYACSLDALTYHSPKLHYVSTFSDDKTHVIGNLRVGLVAGNINEGELAVLLLSAKGGGAGGLSGEEGDGDGLEDGHG